MNHYKKSFPGLNLNGAIELVKATATLIDIFRSCTPITKCDDSRIQDLQQTLRWFTDWKNFSGDGKKNHPNKSNPAS